MKSKILFFINAIVALVFAAGLLLSSKTILGLFHLTVGTTSAANASMNYVAQLLGASMILAGLLSWFAGGMSEAGARRSSVISFFVFHLVGFAVSLLAMLAKAMSTSGWGLVVIFLLFALGYGYFLFMKPADI